MDDAIDAWIKDFLSMSSTNKSPRFSGNKPRGKPAGRRAPARLSNDGKNEKSPCVKNENVNPANSDQENENSIQVVYENIDKTQKLDKKPIKREKDENTDSKPQLTVKPLPADELNTVNIGLWRMGFNDQMKTLVNHLMDNNADILCVNAVSLPRLEPMDFTLLTAANVKDAPQPVSGATGIYLRKSRCHAIKTYLISECLVAADVRMKANQGRLHVVAFCVKKNLDTVSPLLMELFKHLLLVHLREPDVPVVLMGPVRGIVKDVRWSEDTKRDATKQKIIGMLSAFVEYMQLRSEYWTKAKEDISETIMTIMMPESCPVEMVIGPVSDPDLVMGKMNVPDPPAKPSGRIVMPRNLEDELLIDFQAYLTFAKALLKPDSKIRPLSWWLSLPTVSIDSWQVLVPKNESSSDTSGTKRPVDSGDDSEKKNSKQLRSTSPERRLSTEKFRIPKLMDKKVPSGQETPKPASASLTPLNKTPVTKPATKPAVKQEKTRGWRGEKIESFSPPRMSPERYRPKKRFEDRAFRPRGRSTEFNPPSSRGRGRGRGRPMMGRADFSVPDIMERDRIGLSDIQDRDMMRVLDRDRQDMERNSIDVGMMGGNIMGPMDYEERAMDRGRNMMNEIDRMGGLDRGMMMDVDRGMGRSMKEDMHYEMGWNMVNDMGGNMIGGPMGRGMPENIGRGDIRRDAPSGPGRHDMLEDSMGRVERRDFLDGSMVRGMGRSMMDDVGYEMSRDMMNDMGGNMLSGMPMGRDMPLEIGIGRGDLRREAPLGMAMGPARHDMLEDGMGRDIRRGMNRDMIGGMDRNVMDRDMVGGMDRNVMDRDMGRAMMGGMQMQQMGRDMPEDIGIGRGGSRRDMPVGMPIGPGGRDFPEDIDRRMARRGRGMSEERGRPQEDTFNEEIRGRRNFPDDQVEFGAKQKGWRNFVDAWSDPRGPTSEIKKDGWKGERRESPPRGSRDGRGWGRGQPRIDDEDQMMARMRPRDEDPFDRNFDRDRAGNMNLNMGMADNMPGKAMMMAGDTEMSGKMGMPGNNMMGGMVTPGNNMMGMAGNMGGMGMSGNMAGMGMPGNVMAGMGIPGNNMMVGMGMSGNNMMADMGMVGKNMMTDMGMVGKNMMGMPGNNMMSGMGMPGNMMAGIGMPGNNMMAGMGMPGNNMMAGMGMSGNNMMGMAGSNMMGGMGMPGMMGGMGMSGEMKMLDNNAGARMGMLGDEPRRRRRSRSPEPRISMSGDRDRNRDRDRGRRRGRSPDTGGYREPPGHRSRR